MCLLKPQMDVMFIKGDAVNLSSLHLHVTLTLSDVKLSSQGSDAMFSSHVIDLPIKHVAYSQHNGLDCVAKVRSR